MSNNYRLTQESVKSSINPKIIIITIVVFKYYSPFCLVCFCKMAAPLNKFSAMFTRRNQACPGENPCLVCVEIVYEVNLRQLLEIKL